MMLEFSLVLFALVGRALAIPASIRVTNFENTTDPSIEVRAAEREQYTSPDACLSPKLLNMLREGSHWSQIAYCTIWFGYRDGPMEKACKIYNFTVPNTDIVYSFSPPLNDVLNSGAGIVAVDHDQRRVVLSFRGSVTPADWVSDLFARQCVYKPVMGFDIGSLERDEGDHSQELPECVDCKVHCGVFLSFASFFRNVYNELKPWLDQGHDLLITGHSLGGAYAQLAGLELKRLGHNPTLLSYGQLRLGDPNLAIWTNELFNSQEESEHIGSGGLIRQGTFVRSTHESDPVPRLPPQQHHFSFLSKARYSHSGVAIEVKGYNLPQSREEIKFLGITDPWNDWEFKADTTDPRTFIGISHAAYYVPVQIPQPNFDDGTFCTVLYTLNETMAPYLSPNRKPLRQILNDLNPLVGLNKRSHLFISPFYDNDGYTLDGFTKDMKKWQTQMSQVSMLKEMDDAQGDIAIYEPLGQLSEDASDEVQQDYLEELHKFMSQSED